MSKPQADRIPFAKISLFFVLAFVAGLGLAGLSFLWDIGADPQEKFRVGVLGSLALIILLISALALGLTIVVWIIAGVVGIFRRGSSEPQRLLKMEDGSSPPND
jgi:hypothetical protein